MPADIFSSILGLLNMGTGNDNNAWGDNLNNLVFTVLEKAIAGYSTHAVTGGTLTLDAVTPPAGATTAAEIIQNFTGVLGSNQIVQVPNASKTWLVRNNCTGAFTLTFKTATGAASAAIPQSGWAFVYCDGANNISVGLSTALRDVQLAGPDGVVGVPAMSFVNETNSGIYRKSAGVIGISILGVEIADISATGLNVVTGGLTVGGFGLIASGTEACYAGIELPSGGWLWEDGTAQSRAGFPFLLAAITKTCTGNTHANTTIDNLSTDLRGKGLEGAFIEGTGIAIGTRILTINSATSLTTSATVAGTNTGVSLRILPHGQGDGGTTFNVPDRRYRTLVGRDDMNNNNAGRSSSFAGKQLATTGGEESHTISSAEMPAHTHTGTTSTESALHTHTYVGTTSGGQSWGQGDAVGSIGRDAAFTGTTSTESVAHTHTFTTSSTGSGSSHNNMQPFGITNYIIKT